MKKKLIIIGVCFTIILLLTPLKYQYFDGGTVEYRAVLYSVIKWHQFDNNYESGFKTGTDFHFFPANLRKLDYYKDTNPQRLELYYNDKKYYANTLDFKWCNRYNNCTQSEVLLVKDIGYEDAIVVKSNDIIKTKQYAKIKKINIYKGTLDNLYSSDIEYTDEYIKVPNESGEFTYILECYNNKNYVRYLFKVKVEI